MGDALWLKPRAEKGQSPLRGLRNLSQSPKETSLLPSPWLQPQGYGGTTAGQQSFLSGLEVGARLGRYTGLLRVLPIGRKDIYPVAQRLVGATGGAVPCYLPSPYLLWS